ncbi:MAG: sterol desaturase family protein [Chromatiales bacterium]|nr:sterol desaturase family protein [Chromatiales bacterium]
MGLLTRLSLPPIALSIIGILIIDLLSYTYHLAAHKVNWLWRIHAVHHSEQSLDATTSLRFHPIDFLLGSLWKMVGATILGIPLWVIALYQILIIPLSIFQHANIHVPAWVERIFGWLLITPAIHKHHHSIVRREHDSNYGVGLVIWDRLFATLQQPEHPTPKQTGVKGLETEASQTIFGMLLTPLRYKPLKETAITNSDSV